MTSDFSLHDAGRSWLPAPAVGEATGAVAGALRAQAHALRRARHRGPLRLVRCFDAPPAAVFAAWVDPTLAGAWLFATAGRPMDTASIDPRAGGRFRFAERRGGRSVVHHGRYFDMAWSRRLAFVLHSPDFGAIATIGVDIAPRRRGCALALIHAGAAPADLPRVRQRWLGMLYGLGCTLERVNADREPQASSTARSSA